MIHNIQSLSHFHCLTPLPNFYEFTLNKYEKKNVFSNVGNILSTNISSTKRSLILYQFARSSCEPNKFLYQIVSIQRAYINFQFRSFELTNARKQQVCGGVNLPKGLAFYFLLKFIYVFYVKKRILNLWDLGINTLKKFYGRILTCSFTCIYDALTLE